MRGMFLACLMAFGVAFPAAAGEFVGEKDLALTGAFIPVGYDSNDSIEIVVSGDLPSSCFKVNKMGSQKGHDTTITITVSANEFSGDCHGGPIAFYQTIPLGRLRDPGDYPLIDGTSKRELGVLHIDRAGSSGHGTDRVLYAPLTDAYLIQGEEQTVLRLVGAFSDSCLDFKRVDFRTGPKVVVVLPEVAPGREGECRKGTFPFERDFPMEVELPAEPFLLHVRSMSGRAVNKIVMPR